MNFEYTKEKRPDAVVLHLKGDLIDKTQSGEFIDEIDSMITGGNNKFILDLAELTYMNSSGLNVIINVLTKSRKSGGDVAIANVTKKVKQLLVITKLNSILNVSESVDDAITKLN